MRRALKGQLPYDVIIHVRSATEYAVETGSNRRDHVDSNDDIDKGDLPGLDDDTCKEYAE